MRVEGLIEARRVLGFAAIGFMIAAPVAAHARQGIEGVQGSPSARKALDALNRGLLPSASICREGQRELRQLVDQDRVQQAQSDRDVPRG